MAGYYQRYRQYRSERKFLIIFLVILVLSPFLIQIGILAGHYCKGVYYMEQGRYEEAGDELLTLAYAGFLDSFSRWTTCKEMTEGPDWYKDDEPLPTEETEDLATAPAVRPSRRPYVPDDDPYDVNEFSNEEDFYDYWSEDFADFYDAENYFSEHHED